MGRPRLVGRSREQGPSPSRSCCLTRLRTLRLEREARAACDVNVAEAIRDRAGDSTEIHVIVNWFDDLRRRVPLPK